MNLFSQPLFLIVGSGLTLMMPILVNAQPLEGAQPTEHRQFIETDTQSVTPATIDFELMMTADSPAQPIEAFLHEWDAPLDSGDHAYAQGRMSINITPKANSGISYGIGWRYDYLMTFSEETAEVYWRYKNEKFPSTAKRYPLYLEAKHNERVGANVGFSQSITPKWQLITKANIWQGLHIVDGTIDGTLTSRPNLATKNQTLQEQSEQEHSIQDSIATTHADINYFYDKPQLQEDKLDWHPNKPDGYGYSMDIGLIGQLTDKTTLEVHGYDVLGRMHWRETPTTQYRLDYDLNGRPSYSLEGQLDRKDMTQSLPWRIETSLNHQLGEDWQVGLHSQTNDIQSLYQIEAGYHFKNKHLPMTITGLIEPQTKAFGLTLDSQYGGLKILTDDLDSQKAKRSEISLYGRYAW